MATDRHFRFPTWDQFLISLLGYSLAISIPYSLFRGAQDLVPPGSGLFFLLLLIPSAVFAFYYPLIRSKPSRIVGNTVSILILVCAILPMLAAAISAIIRSIQD